MMYTKNIGVFLGIVVGIFGYSSAAMAGNDTNCKTITGFNNSSAKVCPTELGNNKDVHRYLGIPYGSAGVWEQATLADYSTFAGEIPVFEQGPKCLQGTPPDGESALLDPLSGKQTCLNLNIWAPAKAVGAPVMLYIHGGAFIFGSNFDGAPETPVGETIYDGLAFAQNHGMVIVAINYRLGALGFLPIKLGEQKGDTVSATAGASNFGLRDQQLGVDWVRRNIRAFGGDPDKITLFGESAGAMSVGIHITNKNIAKATPGVTSAIMESNPLGVKYRVSATSGGQADRFLKCLSEVTELKCDGTGLKKGIKLKDLDATKIATKAASYLKKDEIREIVALGVPGVLPFTPVIDDGVTTGSGPVMPHQPTAVLHTDGPMVPTLFGFNRTEGVLFAQAANVLKKGKPVIKAKTYGFLVGRAISPELVGPFTLDTAIWKKKYKRYNIHVYKKDSPYGFGSSVDPGPRDPKTGTFDLNQNHPGVLSAMASMLTDFGFVCGNMAVRRTSGKFKTKMWAYRLDQSPAAPVFNNTPLCDPNTPSVSNSNVCHISELPYVFNSLAQAGFGVSATLKSPEQRTADLMSKAWADFAKNHATTGPGATWAEWSGNAPSVNVIKDGGHSPVSVFQLTTDKAAFCTLWDKHIPLEIPKK